MIGGPYLKSERHFRRYEPYLKAIVTQWPNLVVFTPQPPVCSVETLASRIRICIKALHDAIQGEGEWDCSFDLMRFVQIADEIVVSTTAQAGKVVCGPEDKIRKQVPLGVQIEPPIEQVIPQVHLVNPDEDLFMAVIVFHHNKLLTEPSTVEITDERLIDINNLMRSYDVAIEKSGNIYTII